MQREISITCIPVEYRGVLLSKASDSRKFAIKKEGVQLRLLTLGLGMVLLADDEFALSAVVSVD